MLLVYDRAVQTHIRILGILNLVMGGLGVLAAIIIFLVLGGIAGFVGAAAEAEGGIDAQAAAPILTVVFGIIGIFVLVVSLPGIVAGLGLLHYREWARILTIVLSAINLLNVPIGTLLGAYGLWVLLQKETVELFTHPPQRNPGYRQPV